MLFRSMAYLSIVQTAKNVDCRNDEYKYFTLKIEFSEKCVSAITEHFWKMPRGQRMQESVLDNM